MADNFVLSYPNSPELKHDATAETPAVEHGAPADASVLGGGGVPDQNSEPKTDESFAAFKKTDEASEKSEPKLGDGISEALREHRAALKAEFPFQDPTKDYRHIGLEESFTAAGIVGEQATEWINESKRMLADFGLTTGEGKEIVQMLDHYAANPVDEAQEARWFAESFNALVRQHGVAEAHALLRDAGKLIQRDPRVRQLLANTKTWGHPKIIAKAVALARSEKGRGRLK